MHHSLWRGCLLALAGWTSSACGPEFPPYNQVDGLRVLAIAADPPFVAPDAPTAISALVTADTTAVEHHWRWCPLTAGPAARHACLVTQDQLPAGLPPLDLGAEPTTAWTWPAGPGASDALAQLCALVATREAPDDAIRLDCSAAAPVVAIGLEVRAGDATILALDTLRVALSDDFPRNTPPRLGALRIALADEPSTAASPLAAGAALRPSTEYRLEVELDEGESESWRAADGTVHREVLRVTWFVGAGETEVVRSGYFPSSSSSFSDVRTNRWTTPAEPGDVTLHLVVRDDRGGTSWRIEQVRVGGAS